MPPAPPSRNKCQRGMYAYQDGWQHKNLPSGPSVSPSRICKMEEDPDLIATLIPIDKYYYAESAFSLKHNEKRCIPPIHSRDEGPAISSRESTPAYSLQEGDNDDYSRKYCLRLTFEKEPKDPAKGFAFGTDQQKCDVLLGTRGVRGTSGVHFHITFDVIRGKKRLVLRDTSTNGSAVSYDGQAEHEVRHHFTWILNLDKPQSPNGDTQEWKLQVHVRKLEFKFELASHRTCEAEYNKYVDEFLKLSQTTDPPLGGLSIESHTTEVAPSQSRTPGQRPIYIRAGLLGEGSFGRVNRVVDVSTGAIYARKTFHQPPTDIQRQRWLGRIRREIRIMREHPHEHIVPILDFQEDPRPFFIMKYLPLGNLQGQHTHTRLTEGEAVELLFQGLTVLDYLHSRGVAYRDLKPDNILVEGRSPLRVQFADFGLAIDQPELKTFCGSEQYNAPEIFIGGRYTAAVDIWSLAVIVLEYVYGLPKQHQQTRASGQAAMRERGSAWCRCLVKHARDWDSDLLIDLLTSGMLRIKAEERLSAAACLMKGSGSGLFDKSSVALGRLIPRQTKALPIVEQNEEEVPTVILSKLWDTRRKGGSHNSDDQARPSISNRRSAKHGVTGCLSDEDGPQPQTGTPEAISGSSKVRSRRLGSKRDRSPAMSSCSSSSPESRVKRRPEACLTQVRTSQASKVLSEPDHADEVVPVDSKHIGMEVDSQMVLVCKQDRTINATQIVKLTPMKSKEQHNKLVYLRRIRKHKIKAAGGTSNTWICIHCGKDLCIELGLEKKLRPLLDHVANLQGHLSDEIACDRHPLPMHVRPLVKKSGAGHVEKMADDPDHHRVLASRSDTVLQPFQGTNTDISGPKRCRSPAADSPKNSSDEGRVRRQTREAQRSKVRASGAVQVFPGADPIDNFIHVFKYQHVPTSVEVVKAKPGYLQMTVDDQVVLLQEDKCLINATQILKLCPLSKGQRAWRLKALGDKGKAEKLRAYPVQISWLLQTTAESRA